MLDLEKLAAAVLLNVFNIAFPVPGYGAKGYNRKKCECGVKRIGALSMFEIFGDLGMLGAALLDIE